MAAPAKKLITAEGFHDLLLKLLIRFETLKQVRSGRSTTSALQMLGIYREMPDIDWAEWPKYFKLQAGNVGKYLGFASNNSKSTDFIGSDDNLRGCIYRYYTDNPGSTAAMGIKQMKKKYPNEDLLKGDYYVRTAIWENIKMLNDEPGQATVGISLWALLVFQHFLADEAQWNDFLHKSDVSHLNITPEGRSFPTDNWHSFHCFFSGEDTKDEVYSFHLLVNILPDTDTYPAKILNSPQRSHFDGQMTTGKSGHYVAVDLHSGVHQRPLRILFKKRSTEDSIEKHELLPGIYMFINKDGEALHKGYVYMTCNTADTKTEALDLLARPTSSVDSPPVPDVLRQGLARASQGFNFKVDTIEAVGNSLKKMRIPADQKTVSHEPILPLDPLDESLHNTYWLLRLREPEYISDLVLHISAEKIGSLNKCSLMLFEQEYEDYEGVVGVDKIGLWLIFNLFTKKSQRKNVHLKVGLPSGVKDPSLLIGQISYIRTSKPVVATAAIVMLEKIVADPKQLKSYVKDILIDTPEYNELNENDKLFFSTLHYLRIQSPSEFIASRLDFDQKLIRILKERSLSATTAFPSSYLKKDFYLYSHEIARNGKSCIVKGVLSIGISSENVKLINPVLGYGTDDYIGRVRLMLGDMLYFELWSVNGESDQPTLYITVNIVANEQFRYPAGDPSYRKYCTGAYLGAYNNQRIRTGTVVMEHIRSGKIDNPEQYFPSSPGFQDIPAPVRSFLREKNRNYIAVPGRIKNNHDWDIFFAEHQQHNFNKTKKQISSGLVYIAAPATGLNKEEYDALKLIVSRFSDKLKQDLGYDIYAPFISAHTQPVNVGSMVASREILEKMKAADWFILFYPKPVLSSSMVELGMALAEQLPIHVFYSQINSLPFLIQDLLHSNRISSTTFDEQQVMAWLDHAGRYFFGEK